MLGILELSFNHTLPGKSDIFKARFAVDRGFVVNLLKTLNPAGIKMSEATICPPLFERLSCTVCPNDIPVPALKPNWPTLVALVIVPNVPPDSPEKSSRAVIWF